MTMLRKLSVKEIKTAIFAACMIGAAGLVTLGTFWLVLPSSMFDWQQMLLMLPIHTAWLFGFGVHTGLAIFTVTGSKLVGFDTSSDDGLGFIESAAACSAALAVAVCWAVLGFKWMVLAYLVTAMVAGALVIVARLFYTAPQTDTARQMEPSHSPPTRSAA